jgi:hypothetical protein
MTATFCIFHDTHPAGDYLVREYSMRGDHTSAREAGRAETIEAARALIPAAETRTRVERREDEDSRILETWL